MIWCQFFFYFSLLTLAVKVAEGSCNVSWRRLGRRWTGSLSVSEAPLASPTDLSFAFTRLKSP